MKADIKAAPKADAAKSGLVELLKPLSSLMFLGAATVCLVWVYWNSLQETAEYWDNPKYSHGYLIPAFAAVLLWLRRDAAAVAVEQLSYLGAVLAVLALILCFGTGYVVESQTLKSAGVFLGVVCGIFGALLMIQQPIPFANVNPIDRWWGVGLLSVGFGARLFFTYFLNKTPEMYSFVISLAGVFLIVGGRGIVRWSFPSVGYLAFMFPLPPQLDGTLLAKMQDWATWMSTIALQTLGVRAYREGNIISVGDQEIQMQVVEACSGLRMLTIFVALAIAVLLVLKAPLWQWIVVIVSSFIIALAVNVVRITATGIMYLTLDKSIVDDYMGHDVAGWLMMPLALGLLLLEFQVLWNLFIEDDDAGPMSIGLGPQHPMPIR